MAVRMPGGITVSREAVYALRPGLDAKIAAHFTWWRMVHPIGTLMTVDRALNCEPGCGCEPGVLLHVCKGFHGHGMALEVVMDVLLGRNRAVAPPVGLRVITERVPFLVVRVD
jgi:hypothetical protein